MRSERQSAGLTLRLSIGPKIDPPDIVTLTAAPARNNAQLDASLGEASCWVGRRDRPPNAFARANAPSMDQFLGDLSAQTNDGILELAADAARRRRGSSQLSSVLRALRTERQRELKNGAARFVGAGP